MALLADALLENGLDVIRSAQHAGRGAAHLNEIFTDRSQIEHGVERCHFQHADIGHAQHIGDLFNGRLWQPIIMLLLRAP